MYVININWGNKVLKFVVKNVIGMLGIFFVVKLYN